MFKKLKEYVGLEMIITIILTIIVIFISVAILFKSAADEKHIYKNLPEKAKIVRVNKETYEAYLQIGNKFFIRQYYFSVMPYRSGYVVYEIDQNMAYDKK